MRPYLTAIITSSLVLLGGCLSDNDDTVGTMPAPTQDAATADATLDAQAGLSTRDQDVTDSANSGETTVSADTSQTIDSQPAPDTTTGSSDDATSPPNIDTTGDTDATTDGDGTAAPTKAARYRAGAVHSPITAHVAKQMRAIAANSSKNKANVFMKVGASSTVSKKTLYCFAGNNVDLGAYKALQPTLSYFLGGKAANTTPFDRKTKAAISGKTAKWAITGTPSPVTTEITALSPQSALLASPALSWHLLASLALSCHCWPVLAFSDLSWHLLTAPHHFWPRPRRSSDHPYT